MYSEILLWQGGDQEKEVQRQEDQEGKYGGLEQGGGTVEEEIWADLTVV